VLCIKQTDCFNANVLLSSTLYNAEKTSILTKAVAVAPAVACCTEFHTHEKLLQLTESRCVEMDYYKYVARKCSLT